MDTLTQLDAWLEDHLPANLAALPIRIADSLSSTSQIIIDSSHTVITTLTQYGPVFPSSSSSPTASTTATNDDGLFDFWRTSPPPPSPPATTPTATATTTTDNNNKHSPLSLFTATASTATLIALGLTSLILIPPPRPGLKAHYGGPIWLPYLPGDLPTHIHSLFSSKKPPLRRQLSSSSAGGARTEAVLVLGADTPLGRTVSLHLATQGYIVLPVVSSPQAIHTWAALTPPSSRGYIAPLLLAIRNESEAASALEGFKGELEGVLGRRFPLTTAGEPYARPEEKIRLIGVVNTLSFFLPSSSTTDKTTTAVIQEQEQEEDQEEDSQTSTPAESIILNQNITVTDSSVLSDHLYKHVVAPLSAIEIILPILRKHATPSSSTLLTSLILNLRAVGPEGGKMGRMEGIIHAALDRALDSLRVECVALDRAERGAGAGLKKSKGRRRSSAAGGSAENAPSSSSGGTYRPGQFDARFFVKVDLSRSKKDKDEEEQGGKKGKGKRRRRKDRSALDMNPSVKIVDMQLTDWERSSSSSPSSGAANVFTSSSHTQHPHPFQTRTTPASLALLTPLSDIVRLFGTVNTTRAGRCPETVMLRLLPPGPASGGVAMVRRSIMENKIVTILRSYLRSGLGVFGGGEGSVLAIGLGRSLRAFWGNMLGVVGFGGRRGRTLGGGGGRRAGRREREGQVSGEMGLVRRSGSGGGEEDDEEGGGGYEILPSASSLGRTSFSQSQLPPGVGESASSSATLGPRGESSSTRTAIRPSPFSRQSQGPPLSTPSSPASSVRGMVLPPAPSASASPPTHPSNAPQQSGHPTMAGGGGSATPLSLSASVMELPSSVPSSAYGGEEGEYDSYESGVESGVDVEEEEEEEGRTPGVGEGVGEFAGFEERHDGDEGGADGGGAAVLGDSWVAVSQSRSDVAAEVDQAEGEGGEKVEKGQDVA